MRIGGANDGARERREGASISLDPLATTTLLLPPPPRTRFHNLAFPSSSSSFFLSPQLRRSIPHSVSAPLSRLVMVGGFPGLYFKKKWQRQEELVGWRGMWPGECYGLLFFPLRPYSHSPPPSSFYSLGFFPLFPVRGWLSPLFVKTVVLPCVFLALLGKGKYC